MAVSRIWVVVLGVLTLAASCICGRGGGPGAGSLATTSPPGSADRVCTPRACISLRRLARSIDSQLKGTVAGYVALVGHSHVMASGLARRAADPPKLAMGPDVMVNVASVGKMFTTIAVLQSLARHHLSIDSRIAPFLPPDWVKGPGVGTITFGDLLTHRAGFRLDTGLVFAIARQPGYRGKYGGNCDGQACSQTFFGILAGTIPMVIATNSTGPLLQTVVQTALRAAASPR